MKRFWDKVSIKKPCWEWLAGKDKDGYGRFWLNGRFVRAHRFSYELAFGPIPTNQLVCHTCDNTSCVNPGHLFVGTQQDNIRDKYKKGRAANNLPVIPQRGDMHKSTKISDKDVVELRKMYESGEYKQSELADFFNISRPQVNNIVRYKQRN